MFPCMLNAIIYPLPQVINLRVNKIPKEKDPVTNVVVCIGKYCFILFHAYNFIM